MSPSLTPVVQIVPLAAKTKLVAQVVVASCATPQTSLLHCATCSTAMEDLQMDPIGSASTHCFYTWVQ